MTAMDHDPASALYHFCRRLGKTWWLVAATGGRADAPAIGTDPPAAPLDDTGLAVEEPPPEPAWVELSRSCCF